MTPDQLAELKRRFPQDVLDRRDDAAALLAKAISSGDKKQATELRKILRKYDRMIADYGLKRHA